MKSRNSLPTLLVLATAALAGCNSSGGGGSGGGAGGAAPGAAPQSQGPTPTVFNNAGRTGLMGESQISIDSGNSNFTIYRGFGSCTDWYVILPQLNLAVPTVDTELVYSTRQVVGASQRFVSVINFQGGWGQQGYAEEASLRQQIFEAIQEIRSVDNPITNDCANIGNADGLNIHFLNPNSSGPALKAQVVTPSAYVKSRHPVVEAHFSTSEDILWLTTDATRVEANRNLLTSLNEGESLHIADMAMVYDVSIPVNAAEINAQGHALDTIMQSVAKLATCYENPSVDPSVLRYTFAPTIAAALAGVRLEAKPCAQEALASLAQLHDLHDLFDINVDVEEAYARHFKTAVVLDARLSTDSLKEVPLEMAVRTVLITSFLEGVAKTNRAYVSVPVVHLRPVMSAEAPTGVRYHYELRDRQGQRELKACVLAHYSSASDWSLPAEFRLIPDTCRTVSR